MILIADSGSTKTEWRLISSIHAQTSSCITKGINPFYQSSSDILNTVKEEYTLNNLSPQYIYFYGAGCANQEKNKIVKEALSKYFKTNNIFIDSDLSGAAKSLCQSNEGIACILGTGSNSCYYNGREITENVSPLGFIIGDEGSGAVLGKKLIGDVLKKQLPNKVLELFFQEYETSASIILDNIYKQPFPNRYLAQFTRFISKHIDIKEIEELVITSFEEFIKRNLLQYRKIHQLEIHFIGSIAFHFKTQLKKALSTYDLTPGNISQSPMDGLIKYHQRLKNDYEKR